MTSRKPLRRSLWLGAAYDLVLGLFTLTAGPLIMEQLGHPVPEPGYFFRLSLLPLFILPVFYVAAARAQDVDVFKAPVLWARAGGGAAILILTAVLRPGASWLFFLIGGLDLAWAALHRSLWRTRSS